MKKLTKLLAVFLLWAMVCGLWTASSYAEVPHLINYQGKLTDKDNKPLEGTYTITFRIYDASDGGNLLWNETQNVTIQKGLFSVLLGSTVDLDLPFDKPYFLEIKVGNEVMDPRQRITSAGYTYKAENADKLGGQDSSFYRDADKVDGIHAAATPTAGYLYPLNANSEFPASALQISGSLNRLHDFPLDSDQYTLKATGYFYKYNEDVFSYLVTLHMILNPKENKESGARIAFDLRIDGESKATQTMEHDVPQRVSGEWLEERSGIIDISGYSKGRHTIELYTRRWNVYGDYGIGIRNFMSGINK